MTLITLTTRDIFRRLWFDQHTHDSMSVNHLWMGTKSWSSRYHWKLFHDSWLPSYGFTVWRVLVLLSSSSLPRKIVVYNNMQTVRHVGTFSNVKHAIEEKLQFRNVVLNVAKTCSESCIIVYSIQTYFVFSFPFVHTLSSSSSWLIFRRPNRSRSPTPTKSQCFVCAMGRMQ